MSFLLPAQEPVTLVGMRRQVSAVFGTGSGLAVGWVQSFWGEHHWGFCSLPTRETVPPIDALLMSLLRLPTSSKIVPCSPGMSLSSPQWYTAMYRCVLVHCHAFCAHFAATVIVGAAWCNTSRNLGQPNHYLCIIESFTFLRFELHFVEDFFTLTSNEPVSCCGL